MKINIKPNKNIHDTLPLSIDRDDIPKKQSILIRVINRLFSKKRSTIDDRLEQLFFINPPLIREQIKNNPDLIPLLPLHFYNKK
jgi:hypothetical protein